MYAHTTSLRGYGGHTARRTGPGPRKKNRRTVSVLVLWDVVEILDGVASEKTVCRDSGGLVELLEELYTYSLA